MELGRDCAPTNTTTTVSLPSRDAAKLWMIQHQRGRRNWTAEQISYWRGKQYELEKQVSRGGGDKKSEAAQNQKPQSEAKEKTTFQRI